MPETRKDYSRDELIAICEQAIAPMNSWHDRDSASAMRQVGDCWALLKADVPFRIQSDTDEDTIWVEHYAIKGFNHFEYGDYDGDNRDTEVSYLPTPKRLAERAGEDWY